MDGGRRAGHGGGGGAGGSLPPFLPSRIACLPVERAGEGVSSFSALSLLVPVVGEYGAQDVLSSLHIIVRNIITKAARVLHLKHSFGVK